MGKKNCIQETLAKNRAMGVTAAQTMRHASEGRPAEATCGTGDKTLRGQIADAKEVGQSLIDMVKHGRQGKARRS